MKFSSFLECLLCRKVHESDLVACSNVFSQVVGLLFHVRHGAMTQRLIIIGCIIFGNSNVAYHVLRRFISQRGLGIRPTRISQ